MEAKELLSGMIRRKLFVVLSEPVAGHPGADELFLEHLQHLVRWEQDGILFAGGPFLESGEMTHRAMYILRAETVSEAEDMARQEPFHRVGARQFSVHEWRLNEGRIHVSIDFSTQRGGLDGPPTLPPSPATSKERND